MKSKGVNNSVKVIVKYIELIGSIKNFLSNFVVKFSSLFH